MPCRIRETRETSLAFKIKRCSCDWGFSCSHSKSRSSHSSSSSSSSSSLTRHRASSALAMCCSDGFPCPEGSDSCELYVGRHTPGHIHFGGHHYYGPSYHHHHDHHHDHHHGQHRPKYSSHKDTYVFGGGGGERHSMNVVDMTSNSLAHERGHFYTISFPLHWTPYDLLKRLTSNPHDFTVLVQGPFEHTFELKDDMSLKKYLGPCSTLEVVQKQRNRIKHVDF